MYKKLRFLTTMLLLAVCCGTWADDTYVKITSTSELEVGAEYLLVNENNDETSRYHYVMGSISNTSTKYGTKVDVAKPEISGTLVIGTSDNVNVLTLGGETDKWTFKTSKENAYLYWSSGNSLATATTVSNKSQWKVSFSGTTLDISNVGTTSRHIKYNITSPRFACYESGQSSVCLYKKQENSNKPATPTFSPTIGTTFGNDGLDVTISQSENKPVYYNINSDEDPTSSSTLYTGSIHITETSTIKAVALDETEYSNVATATYTYVDPNAPGTKSNPYTVAQARAAIDAGEGVTDVYATGIVSEIVTAYDSQYGNITYNISADGTTTADQLEVYRGKSYNGDNFTSDADIQVGDVVVVYGTLQKYGNTYEFAKDNQLVSLQRPVITTPSISLSENTINVTADGADGTINVTYSNITDVLADVKFYEANGENEATYDWVTAEVNTNNNNLDYVIGANSGEARTAYMKVYALDNEENYVYSELITISQAAYVAPAQPGNWVLTNLADLTADDVFVIVGTDADTNATYALPNNGGTSSAPSAVSISIADNKLSGEPANELKWNIGGNATDGYTFYPADYNEKWLYCTNTNNGVRVGTNNSKTFKLENGYLKHDGTSRYVGIYNSQDWRCYTSINNNIAGQTFSFYKKTSAAYPAVTFSENDTEATTITANDNKLVNATLERTLSNTYWSTFSVPFNVTADQVTAVLGEDVGLRKFQGSEGTVIKFQEATTIEAGHAYLVKPAETVTNPVFNGVTVVNTTGEPDNDSYGYGFVGAVIKKTLKTDQTELFLGTDAKFYYPESDAVATMKGLRGYFVVPAGTKTSKLSVDVEGSGIATTINSMNIEGMGDGNIYNLNGQRVNAPQKGLYIVNGKKVIIK